MIRYAVTKGRPDTKEKCTVTASVDGEEIAYYDGYFDPYRRRWTLYISLSEGANRVEGKIILPEREVHYEVRPAMMARKTDIQRKPAEKEKTKPAEQIKLV